MAHKWHELPTSLRFIEHSFGKASFVLFLCGFFAGVAVTLIADALVVEWILERMP